VDSLLSVDAANQFVSILFGGGFVSLFWNWRNDRLAQYRYLDEVYSALLAEYRARPSFGDRQKTQTYQTAFAKQPLRYHYFAMSVMNTMETIFDVLHSKPLKHPQWGHIFSHHVTLHWAWLDANQDAFEPEFVAYVRSMNLAARTRQRAA